MLCVNSRDADNYAYQQGLEEDKKIKLEEVYEDIHIDEDTLVSILSNQFGDKINCFAVDKAREDSYELFIKLHDALCDFSYEVAKQDISYN